MPEIAINDPAMIDDDIAAFAESFNREQRTIAQAMLAVLRFAAGGDPNPVARSQGKRHRMVHLKAIGKLDRRLHVIADDDASAFLKFARVLIKLDQVAGIVFGRVGLLCIGQVRRYPRIDNMFTRQLVLPFQPRANGGSDSIGFRVRRGNNESGLVLAILCLLGNGREIRIRHLLVAFAIGNLLYPAKFAKLLERLSGAAFTQRFRRFLIVAPLAKDFRDGRDFQPRLFLQKLQRFARRDAAVLPFIPDEDSAGFHPFGHLEQFEHVPRAELARFIDQDDAAASHLLHTLILQEPCHRVGIGKTRFFTQHFPARLD